MGACCGKASKQHDPDRAPYGAPATTPPLRGRGKDRESVGREEETEPLVDKSGHGDEEDGIKGGYVPRGGGDPKEDNKVIEKQVSTFHITCFIVVLCYDVYH